MESTIGRYFEGRLLETQQLLRFIYDVAHGQGGDVCVWIDGREMVFGRGDPQRNRGFLRVTPGEVAVTLGFPQGSQLFDPKKRAKGPAGAQTSLSITHSTQLDLYVRRLVDQAYALDG